MVFPSPFIEDVTRVTTPFLFLSLKATENFKFEITTLRLSEKILLDELSEIFVKSLVTEMNGNSPIIFIDFKINFCKSYSFWNC